VPGKSVTTALVEYPPGAYSGPHRHPGEVTAVVLEGLVRSQLGSGPAIVYAAGQTWFEPERTLHAFAENPDPARPARLLAVYVADSNCGPLVIPEK
jgi:quercetin dioxygenase-like cupin family protein